MVSSFRIEGARYFVFEERFLVDPAFTADCVALAVQLSLVLV
jgi:hypothetical protein